jgi:hypothetical protein
MSELLTIREQTQVGEYVDMIVDSIVEDDLALNELLGGYESDLDDIFRVIAEETAAVILPGSKSKIKSSSFYYLNNLTKSVEETYKKASLGYFILTTLPDFAMWLHHLEWNQLCQNYKKTCVIAARDSGKSYYWSFAYVLWHLYRYEKNTLIKRQPKSIQLSKQTLMYSNEYKLLKGHLRSIKEEIQDNPLLSERLYPGKGADWGKEEITTKNGGQVILRSYGSSGRGLHVGNIVVDDLLKDQVLYNDETNSKYIEYFTGVIYKIAVPGAHIRVIGTPFKQNDLYGHMKANPGFTVVEYPIINPDGSLLWEGRHNLDSVMESLRIQGSLVFSREMLCRPISSGATIFPRKMVMMGFDKGFSKLNNFESAKQKLGIDFVVMGCDFAISANVGADYTVYVTLGVKGNSFDTCRLYLLDVWIKKGSTYLEQMNTLKTYNRRYKPKTICLENNVFQQIYVETAKSEKLPVIGHNTNTNKYSMNEGVPSMAVIIEQLRFRMPYADKESIEMTEAVAKSLGSIAYTDKGLCSTATNLEDDTAMAIWKATIAVRKAFEKKFDFGFL